MLIAHIADVHWRGLSRHDEYKVVFEEFVDDCKRKKVDHIFVGGDIFHTKTSGISPEYIEVLTWWLNRMSTVAPVHLILGNHDGNLVNLSRQDAVTPVISALNNPRIHLYKKSGVYEFAPGYNWCVFSLFDEEGWNCVIPTPGSFNIACFHGSVRGSITETGWNIDEGITVDFFEKFNLAFLGDIHRCQALGYRDGKPWIAYPGSTIQQNYAEEIDHGYLLWNIQDFSSWSMKFQKLPNPKPFVTLEWSGSIEDLAKDASQYPNGSRFRVRSSQHISQKETRQINDLLYGIHSASEITYKSDVVIDRATIKTETSSLVKEDLRSPDILYKLVRDHHKNLVVSDDIWQKVSDSIRSILTTVSSSEETTRNSKWSIRRLQFDNMFSYGESNSIDFDSLNGIVGIFGQNRAGKSSVVGTLMYALFNTTDRGPMKNIHICNVRKPYCLSTIVLNHNGSDYIIERQTSKTENKKGIVSASTALNLYRMKEDGDLVELNGEQRTDTEKTIRNLIGNSEDFLMTSLSAQGEINQFISQGSSKRRSVLSRFLDLDIFDRMHELSNKEANSYKSQLKNFPDKEWSSLLDRYASEISEIETKSSILDQESHDKKVSISFLQSELLKHKDFVFVTLDQVESHRRKTDDLQKLLGADLQKIESLRKEIEESQNKINKIDSLRDENDIDDLKRRKEVYLNIKSILSSLRHSLEKEETVLNHQKKSLSILEEVPCGDTFPTCKFIKDAHSNKGKVQEQVSAVDNARNSLEESLQKLTKMETDGFLTRLENLEKIFQLEGKLELEISKKETELAKLLSASSSRKSELKTAEDRLANLEASLKNQENVEVVSIRQNIEELSNIIKEIDAKKIEIATRKGKISAAMEQLLLEKKIRDELVEKLRVQELISSAFSKKGLPLVITKSQLPAINAEISKILHGIVDFSVELENDEETDSSEIYINYGDSRRVIELCSGMEKTIASIAIRVAMINVSTLPRSDIFIIDEGFGTLDASSVEACNRLLSTLKRYFKTIIVITHVDGIKDAVDHTLEITKFEKDTKIFYGGK
jgi:DNA repair exonuclease SbcCD ATPase subunit/DNA repair exonuclease SbcCD nuclease subunit